MTKMNPEVKARWVAALRSGEYKQGKEFLRYGGRFCCLGVLCDLHSLDTGTQWGSKGYAASYCGHAMGFPNEVADWAGMSDSYGAGPYLQINGNPWQAAHHNDYGRSFAEIADAIEKQL